MILMNKGIHDRGAKFISSNKTLKGMASDLKCNASGFSLQCALIIVYLIELKQSVVFKVIILYNV